MNAMCLLTSDFPAATHFTLTYVPERIVHRVLTAHRGCVVELLCSSIVSPPSSSWFKVQTAIPEK